MSEFVCTTRFAPSQAQDHAAHSFEAIELIASGVYSSQCPIKSLPYRKVKAKLGDQAELDRDMQNAKFDEKIHIAPGCPAFYARLVDEFIQNTDEKANISFQNKHSIFINLKNISVAFKQYINECPNWLGKNFIEDININLIGKEESKSIKQSYKPTEKSSTDIVYSVLFNFESRIISSIRWSNSQNFEHLSNSFVPEYAMHGHREYIALLETTRNIIEYIKAKLPKRQLLINKDLDESRIKTKKYFKKIKYCDLCWRQAKNSPNDKRGIVPKYCRIHNQNRGKIANNFNITDHLKSKYRTDKKNQDIFNETIIEIRNLVLSGMANICHPPGTVIKSAEKMQMRHRYIAYFIVKNIKKG